ncbi:MAG: helix-turn-helix transcriptional regulator [Clostridia bacterium]|nr:helix-turn-helix transcriptional regulator [Clostridia bacterium]
MAISLTFKERFIELADELDVSSHTEKSKVIGISNTTYFNIYNYGVIPTTTSLMRIADYFNITIDYLIGNTDIDSFVKSNEPISFWERLNSLRTESNIPTIYKLADSIHIHRNNIAQWKKQSSIPLIDDVELIADYFNVSIDYLLGRTDDRTPYK